MPQFRQIPQILTLMRQKDHIRNISITAHIDHGKTTLTDHLLAEAGLLAQSIAGEARALDYLPEEQRRGITIKTANISLVHDTDGQPYLINLVDTPGHVDFTGKTTQALRATDGTIIVIDAVEEIMPQTETITRQALEERVKPALYINKIDRLITELKLSPKQIENKLTRIITEFNNLIELYSEHEYAEWKINPKQGNVTFGSALHKWAFTLQTAQQQNIRFTDIDKAYQNQTHQKLSSLLPIHKTILDMTVRHLPSPQDAQKYRIPKIWKGNLNTPVGQAMLNCTDTGPIAIYITNTQTDPKNGIIATGRLYSGQIRPDTHVYSVNAKKNLHIQQVAVYMSQYRQQVDKITAGNIAAITVSDAIHTGETIVDLGHETAMTPFEPIRSPTEPVITVGIEPKQPKDLPRIIQALQNLALEDPNLTAKINRETGEYQLSGIGQLHLEIALRNLRDSTGHNTEIITPRPTVNYREAITKPGTIVHAKSPNKLNKITLQVQPLDQKTINLIENGSLTDQTTPKQIAETLETEANWSRDQAENVWAVESHRNILVNSARPNELFSETRDIMVLGFKWACQNGPLCGEPMRGIRATIIDLQLDSNPENRESTQIMPATSRATLGSILTAKPVLLQPVCKIVVTVPPRHVGHVTSVITKEGGKAQTIEPKGPTTVITGLIPVVGTFNLTDEIRRATSGTAFWQATFDHWERISQDKAAVKIQETRKRRGLPSQVPTADKFID